MEIQNEAELIKYGRELANVLTLPTVIELIGDVGAGKTTLTRGLAEGLGVTEPVTSPSFTISKRYYFERNGQDCTLIHYDFYRLPDPGIMREEIAEALSEPNAVVVIEWGADIANLLPENKIRIEIDLNADGTRHLTSSAISPQE